MSLLIEKYNELAKKIYFLKDKKDNIEESIAAIKGKRNEEIQKHIKELEELLKKIDEYILKVQAFQRLAEESLESKNVLTIEAPPGYRVNLNRLRNWSMLIDPMSSNDPYAQRVYVVAKCDEHFLKQKQKEYTEKLEELKSDESQKNLEEIERLTCELSECERSLDDLVIGEEMREFSDLVKTENARYWFETSPLKFESSETDVKCFSPGAYAAPLPINKEKSISLCNQMGRLYDAKTSRVLLPVEISLDKEFVLTISCAPSKDKSLDKGIRNLVLSIINNSKAGMQKVYFLDGVRFNLSALGSLKKLENTFALAHVPRNSEQLTSTLESIVASFADIDDLLEDYESVKDYNNNVDADKKIPLTTIVLYGWPKAFEGRNKELLTKIMSNYERYGVSFVIITYKKSEPIDKEVEDSSLPEYATHNAIHIRMFPDDTTVAFPDEKPQKFTWYVFEDELSDEYVESLKAYTVEKKVVGTEYIKRYSLENVPQYTRGNKSIVLPFGVDGKDQVHTISFDNENFASYLMGASGSGKSTLLHTLITGIIRNYHPDDVELWLADFKMSEFAQYMDPLPPHVKYILLDESQELVYDLIDKLTEKMMERQRFFMKNRDLKKVENVPSNIYMPVIFVILDEFSIMSQAVSESEIYKLRLQNLLAKGRALGIKFIFSSQTFIKGISGLTQTAKDQIQSRIAMKNSYNEINETLELSAGLRTEQVRSWMEALPPYFALLKYRDGDSLKVQRVQGMYFKGKGNEALKPQRGMIKALNDSMAPITIEEYNPNVSSTYVDKKPVIVDGNSYKAFNEKKITALIEEFKKENPDDVATDDVIVTFGSPRRMVSAKFAVISNESRENILLVARGAEQSCAMSLITTTIKSFDLQGGSVQIWAYSKNRLYKTYKDTHFMHRDVYEGMDDICYAISTIKDKIQNKQIGNKLIVLLGMEQICNDFGLIDYRVTAAASASKVASFNSKNLEAKTEEEKQKVKEVADLQAEFNAKYNIDELEDQWIDEGRTLEEIMEETNKLYNEFLKAKGFEHLQNQEESDNDTVQEEQVVSEETLESEAPGAYNALEDLKYIVKQGSRFGYHFMLCLNNVADIKPTQLQFDLFRHKFAFQLSGDDSVSIFSSKIATKLPEHICQYSSALEQYSLRPFIHEGINWDDWDVDSNGEAINTNLI